MKSTFDMKSPYSFPKRRERIDASNFKLKEWLKLLLGDRDSVSPNNHFPNEQAREEYLKQIKGVSEKKIKEVLRNFLPRTGYSQLDIINFKSVLSRSLKKKQFGKIVESSEYLRKIYEARLDVWEGLQWTLDLLPHHPKKAIQTLETYLTANASFISDDLIWSISDSIDIITARYYDLEHPREILLDIEPTEFEWLIEALYKELGYRTELTSKTNDGGIDIIASKKSVGKREKMLIQCKRHRGNVGSRFYRHIFNDPLGTDLMVPAKYGAPSR